jgi:hypothetical protein
VGLNEAATARYFGQLSRESPESYDSLEERDGFGLPVLSQNLDPDILMMQPAQN